MDAALELFSEKGLEKTSSNEIAKRAGVSIGTFYRYFSDKRDLFLEILQAHLESFVTGVYIPGEAGSLSMREHIRRLTARAFGAFDSQRDFHRQALVTKFIDADVRRLFADVENRQLAIITELLVFYGKTPGTRNLAVVAKVVHGAVENAAHAVTFLSSPIDRDSFIDELTEMIHCYITNI